MLPEKSWQLVFSMTPSLAPIQNAVISACLCDCIHIDDVAELLKEKGLDKRPEGK